MNVSKCIYYAFYVFTMLLFLHLFDCLISFILRFLFFELHYFALLLFLELFLPLSFVIFQKNTVFQINLLLIKLE